MNMRFYTRLALIVLTASLGFGCTSKEVQRRNELISKVREDSSIFSQHDIEKYLTAYADDFQWDRASAPARISRSDFAAAISNLPKEDPTIYHFQERVLASGNFAFFDGCSFVGKNPTTGIMYRTYHSDIVEFEGLKIKVMTSFSDGASGDVALGLIEPPLPAPPLPGTRAWPTADPQPTKLKPVDAQKESQNRWNGHDLNSIAKMLRQYARILVSPLFDPVGRDAYVAWMGVMLRAFPDLSVNATRTFDMGDGWVASEVKMSGTNAGPYLGKPATGKPFSLRAAYLGRYDSSGLTTDLKLYFDSMTIMNQLGLKTVPIASPR
jgi:predicted ester cyclase